MAQTSTTPMAEAAIAYAVEVGWRIHPCTPNGKTPLTRSWTRDATNDPDILRAMWRRWPNANPAVACGPDSIDVLDIDSKGSANGRNLAERAWAAGLLNGWVASVRTPSGGRHLWFPGTDQGGGAIGRHRDLELKSAGGYVLVPPATVVKRTDGGTVEYQGIYEVTEHREAGQPIDWQAVKTLLDPPRPPRIFIRPKNAPINFDGLIRHVANQTEGNRNAALFWACCRAVEGGADEQVLDALVDAAVTGGHPRAGAEATMRSAQKRISRSVAA